MRKRGVGMATVFYGTGYGNGFPDVSSAVVEIHDDGSATVLTGAADVGQGSTTIFAQIAAEELGLNLEQITVISADTDITPDAGTTAATRQTYTTGNAIRLAAQRARQELFQAALPVLGVNTTEGLRAVDGYICVKTLPWKRVAIATLASQGRLAGRRYLGKATFTTHTTAVDPETGQGAPYWPYAFATQIAEVEVDTETGKVEVLHVVAAHDVGRAIHTVNIEGQIAGGIAQGCGWALMEEVQLEGGKIKNPTFSGYLIPTALDVPRVESCIIEAVEESGPYGAKGIGEPAMVPAAPAILNAIYDAIGVRIRDLPATPEKILRALHEHK